MLGLIKKDLLLMKGNLKLIVIIFIVFTASAISQDSSNLSSIPALISTMLFMSTFSYDEYNKWNAYATALPTGRKKIVQAKYFATLLLNILVFAITIIISLIISFYTKSINYKETIDTIIATLTAIVIIQAIIYPLIFKFGIEKGRIWLFVGIFGITTIIGLIFSNTDLNFPKTIIDFFRNYYLLVIPFFTIVCLYISYKISANIYLKKEF